MSIPRHESGHESIGMGSLVGIHQNHIEFIGSGQKLGVRAWSDDIRVGYCVAP